MISAHAVHDPRRTPARPIVTVMPTRSVWDWIVAAFTREGC